MKLSNKLLYVLIALFAVQSIISAQNKTLSKRASALLAADQSFARMAEERNPREAFEFYMADDIIFVPVGETLMTDRKKIIEYFSDPGVTKIRWRPLRAEIAKSNDFGFTYGVSEMTFKTDDGKKTTRFYNYVSVWRKNKKGEWRMIVDMGNSHPAAAGTELFKK
jgi:ketosteroid isomerase-like protein